MTTNPQRVLIVGGGVAGLSLAARLAEAGLPVTLLEAGRLGEAASTRNQGWLHSGAWFAPHDRSLARRCLAAHRRTLELCPECVEPDHEGMLFVFGRSDSRTRRWTDSWTAAGIPFHEISPFEAVARVPGLDWHRLYRAFVLPDRSIDPTALVRKLAEVATSRGVEIRQGTPVERLLPTESDRTGVELVNGETIWGDLVVNAANTTGLRLVRGDDEARSTQSEYELRVTGAHLLAVPSDRASWPFCVVDEEGFCHLPHRDVAVLGIDRWHTVSSAANGIPKREADVAAIRGRLATYLPGLRVDEERLAIWSGATVQAFRPEQVMPGRAPLPAVVDHGTERPPRPRLLSVYPGRATLWTDLAADACRLVLARLGVSAVRVAPTPWSRLQV